MRAAPSDGLECARCTFPSARPCDRAIASWPNHRARAAIRLRRPKENADCRFQRRCEWPPGGPRRESPAAAPSRPPSSDTNRFRSTCIWPGSSCVPVGRARRRFRVPFLVVNRPRIQRRCSQVSKSASVSLPSRSAALDAHWQRVHNDRRSSCKNSHRASELKTGNSAAPSAAPLRARRSAVRRRRAPRRFPGPLPFAATASLLIMSRLEMLRQFFTATARFFRPRLAGMPASIAACETKSRDV